MSSHASAAAASVLPRPALRGRLAVRARSQRRARHTLTSASALGPQPGGNGPKPSATNALELLLRRRDSGGNGSSSGGSSGALSPLTSQDPEEAAAAAAAAARDAFSQGALGFGFSAGGARAEPGARRAAPSLMASRGGHGGRAGRSAAPHPPRGAAVSPARPLGAPPPWRAAALARRRLGAPPPWRATALAGGAPAWPLTASPPHATPPPTRRRPAVPLLLRRRGRAGQHGSDPRGHAHGGRVRRLPHCGLRPQVRRRGAARRAAGPGGRRFPSAPVPGRAPRRGVARRCRAPKAPRRAPLPGFDPPSPTCSPLPPPPPVASPCPPSSRRAMTSLMTAAPTARASGWAPCSSG
jgi:hypothetical protein